MQRVHNEGLFRHCRHTVSHVIFWHEYVVGNRELSNSIMCREYIMKGCFGIADILCHMLSSGMSMWLAIENYPTVLCAEST